jgi:AcrR family transcriptional regulator
MANLVAKVPAERWLATAKQVLISDGIDAVKIDRLARQLAVSRGGFYHHFLDRNHLLERLLEFWSTSVVFMPESAGSRTRDAAVQALFDLVRRLIDEDGYDPAFDMAVRAWSHSDKRTAAAVKRSDTHRIALLNELFVSLGCPVEDASIRARVFYFHQIGFYATGIQQSRSVRRREAGTYLRILCGDPSLEWPDATPAP